jgi:hypothetical protein
MLIFEISKNQYNKKILNLFVVSFISYAIKIFSTFYLLNLKALPAYIIAVEYTIRRKNINKADHLERTMNFIKFNFRNPQTFRKSSLVFYCLIPFYLEFASEHFFLEVKNRS